MNRKLAILLALVLLLGAFLTVGCSPDSIDEDEKTVLRLGAVPGEEEQKRRDQYQPFVEYLERELGVEVELFVGSDYTATVEAMRSNKIDLVWYGPLSYLLAADIADAEAFALSYDSELGVFYESYIIVHADSDIYEIADLKGKTFAFVDPASTGGHLIPRHQMVDAGLDPDADLESMVFVGGHDACAEAVKNKHVDGAAIVRHMFERGVEAERIDEEELRIIAVSDPFPGGPLAYRRSLDEGLKEAIRHAIFNMPDEDVQANLEVFGSRHLRFEEADDALFDTLREASKLIDLDL
ncbi:phosphate/phosphite/phosphonate ABC transporter substrate-binding protein [Anoxynatronum sibiricum]|uniref:Phosphate/phosphite/phosphonate ABC transporter substrate-binding protein n=1 Tax=Anoxynatronum sibiricum TaxID=210623 RepID=A0ABU9VT94_9CLOT